MSDRELLELAAKAAGDFTTAKYYRVADDLPVVFMLNDKPWNPLTDDGDALRLAVKCQISFWQAGDTSVADHDALGPKMREPHNGDPYAATRRAIVRAAAQIGEHMEKQNGN